MEPSHTSSPPQQQKGYSLKPFKISLALSSSEDMSESVCSRSSFLKTRVLLKQLRLLLS